VFLLNFDVKGIIKDVFLQCQVVKKKKFKRGEKHYNKLITLL